MSEGRGGRGQKALDQFRSEFEARKQLEEREYQEGLASLDDRPEFESKIMLYLSQGKRGGLI